MRFSKYRLLTIFGLAFTVQVSAQHYKGIQVGLNTSATINVTGANSALFGLNVGGFLGLDRSKKVSSVFELTLRTQGFGDLNDEKVRMYYANAAALLAFQASKKSDKFRLLAGMQPTLFIGKSEPNYPNVSIPIYCDQQDCFEQPKPLGLDVMAGLEYWGSLRSSLRVGHTLGSKNRFQHFYLEFVLGI
jgi:hypothetical protein